MLQHRTGAVSGLCAMRCWHSIACTADCKACQYAFILRVTSDPHPLYILDLAFRTGSEAAVFLNLSAHVHASTLTSSLVGGAFRFLPTFSSSPLLFVFSTSLRLCAESLPRAEYFVCDCWEALYLFGGRKQLPWICLSCEYWILVVVVASCVGRSGGNNLHSEGNTDSNCCNSGHDQTKLGRIL